MDDEKKWNLNAPQNDTENNRQNEPPRYEHYCMHQNTESDTVKELPEKKKNKKRGGKKLAGHGPAGKGTAGERRFFRLSGILPGTV